MRQPKISKQGQKKVASLWASQKIKQISDTLTIEIMSSFIGGAHEHEDY